MGFKETEIGMIPEDWKIVSLGEVADVISGYAFKRVDFIDKGIPVIKIKNIVPPNISLDDVGYVSEKVYYEKTKYQLSYNDILISMTGSNVNQFSSAVGKVGRVKLKNQKLLLNQRVGKIEVKNSKFDEDFLYYIISTDDTKWRLASSAGGSANQANISPKQIRALKLPCPDLKEQQLISSILSSLDEKIETNNQINKILEEMAQAIFKHWFADFEFPNKEGKPYKSSGGEMVESELGMIPKGWKVKSLADVAEFQNGHAFYKVGYSEKGYKVVDLANVNIFANFVEVESDKYVSENVYNNVKYKKYHLLKDDLVMIMTDRTQAMNILGKTAKIPYSNQFILNQRVGRIRVSEGLNVNYLKCTLNSERVLNSLKFKALGTVQKYINTNHIKEIKVLLPNAAKMERFSNIINPYFDKMQFCNEEMKILNHLRNFLLPKLMSGEIRVPLKSEGLPAHKVKADDAS